MEQAIYTIMKYAGNPRYQPTDTEVAHMAKFVVTHGGRAILNDIILRGYIYALGGVFNGTIYAQEGRFSGFVGKKETIVNDGNAQQYIEYYGAFGERVLDIRKTGSWVRFDGLADGFTVMLPCIYASRAYSDDARNYARSLVGNNVILHNTSSVNITVTGNNKMQSSDSAVSFSIDTGEIVTMTCKMSFYTVPTPNGDYKCEDIYWEFSKGVDNETISSIINSSQS